MGSGQFRIGGSATSGQGLTGAQVVAALKATAAAQRERHLARTAPTQAAVQDQVRDKALNIDDEAYKAESTREVKVPASDGGEDTVSVTEYAPEAFRSIRHMSGVEEDFFSDEWDLPEDRLDLKLGEGRSQALFLQSKSLVFMCKTIAEEEILVLREVLQRYTAHLAKHHDSRLMRFYMLLKVRVRKCVGYILCFSSVFQEATVLNEKWDLKGREPKPGKYESFPKLVHHVYEPALVRVGHAAGSADEQSDEPLTEKPGKHKVATRPDKQLTRLFWLDKVQRASVVLQLNNDFQFLSEIGLMDYSVLIGVAYQHEPGSSSSHHGKIIRNMKPTVPLGDEGQINEVEKRPAVPPGLHVGDAQNNFSNGVHSIFDQEVYYIGIIDMLTHYNWRKRVANFCKSFLWEQVTLSTVPPLEYMKRIKAFVDMIFPVYNGATTV